MAISPEDFTHDAGGTPWLRSRAGQFGAHVRDWRANACRARIAREEDRSAIRTVDRLMGLVLDDLMDVFLAGTSGREVPANIRRNGASSSTRCSTGTSSLAAKNVIGAEPDLLWSTAGCLTDVVV